MQKYFCSKCKKNHFRGKIFEDHLKFKKQKNSKNNSNYNTESSIPSDKLLEFEFDELRPIARRQIHTLVMKMQQTKKFSLYTEEINKIILHEKELLR